MDWSNPVIRSGELYEILHRRQIPVIVMETVKGGTLAKSFSQAGGTAENSTARPFHRLLSPAGISIPDVFCALNTARLYPKDDRLKMFYGNLTSAGSGKASACIACGQCEGVCPQHLSIIALMNSTLEA